MAGEPSMVEARSGFGLTAVADGLIATGGYNYNNVQGLPLSSVKVFSFKDGWNLEPRLEMSSTKFGHCSIIMGSWLYRLEELLVELLIAIFQTRWKPLTQQISRLLGSGEQVC